MQTSCSRRACSPASATLFRRFVQTHRATRSIPRRSCRRSCSSSSSATLRYQDTNLEPNIKESPGGLRDLQTVLWIARAAGLGRSWRELARRGVITAAEAREMQQHEQFLQALRIRLHYLAGRREDRLVFDFQTALAREHSDCTTGRTGAPASS